MNKVECSNVFKLPQTTPSCKVKNVATGLSGCLQTSGWLARRGQNTWKSDCIFCLFLDKCLGIPCGPDVSQKESSKNKFASLLQGGHDPKEDMGRFFLLLWLSLRPWCKGKCLVEPKSAGCTWVVEPFITRCKAHRTHCGQMTGWELGIQGQLHIQESWPTALTDQVGWSRPRVCTQQDHDSLLTTVFQHLALGVGLSNYLLDNC